ncbi:hypothetical protein FisN_7Hu314 [Fistulifera solaris]|jgi:hypothetical protein|uniref:Uncharacterized protein n=1 Tax=Fistulifera solaris TaxID=1519565 RepID=A0A1Z5KSX0_FISSO|nr:hypothetical protein FisN_7Hu314 [Fistulifera solaris]|eukprot:GAX29091.1 hypothetical protein FisN_7Hu314 [Fistulifera solaris]
MTPPSSTLPEDPPRAYYSPFIVVPKPTAVKTSQPRPVLLIPRKEPVTILPRNVRSWNMLPSDQVEEPSRKRQRQEDDDTTLSPRRKEITRSPVVPPETVSSIAQESSLMSQNCREWESITKAKE